MCRQAWASSGPDGACCSASRSSGRWIKALHEGAVAELRDQREDIVHLSTLDSIRGPVAAKQAMRCKQPKPGLVWRVELGQLSDEPLEREEPLETLRLRRDLSGPPPRNGLRSGVEQLRHFTGVNPAARADAVQAFG